MGVGRDIGLGKILRYKRLFIVNIYARTRCIAIGNHVTFSISLHNPQSLLLCWICRAVMLDSKIIFMHKCTYTMQKVLMQTTPFALLKTVLVLQWQENCPRISVHLTNCIFLFQQLLGYMPGYASQYIWRTVASSPCWIGWKLFG